MSYLLFYDHYEDEDMNDKLKTETSEAEEKEKLKSCPFCGELPNIWEESDETPFWIQCVNESCAINPAVCKITTKEEVILLWNTRAVSDSIAALEKEIETLRAESEWKVVEKDGLPEIGKYVQWQFTAESLKHDDEETSGFLIGKLIENGIFVRVTDANHGE